jgi:hypothetical protein
MIPVDTPLFLIVNIFVTELKPLEEAHEYLVRNGIIKKFAVAWALTCGKYLSSFYFLTNIFFFVF